MIPELPKSPNAQFAIDMSDQPTLFDEPTAKPVKRKKAKPPQWQKLAGSLRRCDPCVSEAYAASRVGIDPLHASPARWRHNGKLLCYSHAQAIRDNEARPGG